MLPRLLRYDNREPTLQQNPRGRRQRKGSSRRQRRLSGTLVPAPHQLSPRSCLHLGAPPDRSPLLPVNAIRGCSCTNASQRGFAGCSQNDAASPCDQPAASPKALKAIRQTFRRWELHRRSDKDLADLARMFNPAHPRLDQLLQPLLWVGLVPYPAADRRLPGPMGPQQRQRLRARTAGARDWFARVVRADPLLFAHWRLLYVNDRTSGAV